MQGCKGQHTDDLAVGNTHLQHFFNIRLHTVKRLHGKQSYKYKGNGYKPYQQHTVSRRTVYPLFIPFSKFFGQYGINAHAKPDPNADSQILDRHTKRDCR